eukprot:gb/GECH01012933.1/.p1 GENE.gb/GECH01012933.1/~~gb/GECH01012933.1/.p1  ORF type:complete len:538 (+),score=124.89 gb/GECH01012933.1/:1-1614(+)
MSTDSVATEQDKKQPGEKTPEQKDKQAQEKLEGQALRDAILKQIEFYFSRQNLSKDAYLVSQMDHDMFVPVEVLANFNLVKTLTTDVDFILDVMKDSKHVQVDASSRKLAPNMTVTRNTVILREIPPDSDEKEVKSLLKGDECPEPQRIRSEVGDNWFITFESESDALDAFFYLQQQKFNGKPVKVGMKSENLLRSQTNNSGQATNNEQALNFKPFFIPSGYQWKKGMDTHSYEPFMKRGYNRPRRRGPRSRKDDRRGRDHGPPNNHKDKPRGGKRKRRGDKGESQRPVPSNSPADFPPLPSSKSKGNHTSQIGYKEDFIKYSKQEIIDTISNIDNCQEPQDLPENCIAIAPSPNTQLELTKPLPQSETLDTAVESGIGNPEHKSFAEAVLTAQDIKTPDGNRKRSGKGRRNSGKDLAKKDSKRKENDQHSKKEEREEPKKRKHKKNRRRNSHKKKQYRPKKNPSTSNHDENNGSPIEDESETSYAAVLKKKQEQKEAEAAAETTETNSESKPEPEPEHENEHETEKSSFVAGEDTN